MCRCEGSLSIKFNTMKPISIIEVLPKVGYVIVDDSDYDNQIDWLKRLIKLAKKCPEVESVYNLDLDKEAISNKSCIGVSWKVTYDTVLMWPIKKYSKYPRFDLYRMSLKLEQLNEENETRKKISLESTISRVSKIILNGGKIDCNKQDAEILAKYFQDPEVMRALDMTCITPFREADDITSDAYRDIRDLIQGIRWSSNTYEFCKTPEWNTPTNIVPLLDDLAKIKRNLKNNKQDENNKVHRKTEGKRERKPRKRLRIPQRQKQIECGIRYPGNPRSTNYRRAQIRSADVCGRARYAGDPGDTEQHHRSEGRSQGIE